MKISQHAQLTVVDQRWSLRGDLNFSSVPEVWRQGVRALAQQKNRCEVNLKEVTHADSAALALLMSWVQLATEKDVMFSYCAPSPQLVQVAKMNHVESFLGFESGGAE